MSFSARLHLFFFFFVLPKLTGDPSELVRDNPASVPVMECWEATEEESKMGKKREIRSRGERSKVVHDVKVGGLDHKLKRC